MVISSDEETFTDNDIEQTCKAADRKVRKIEFESVTKIDDSSDLESNPEDISLQAKENTPTVTLNDDEKDDSQRKLEDDSDTDSDMLQEYRNNKHYKNDLQTPIYSDETPNLKEIVEICFDRISETRVCTKRPYRFKEDMTFVINQNKANIRHPYDLDADDNTGKFVKKENARFYEITDHGDHIDISHEVTTIKNDNGRVISGKFKERCPKTGVWHDVKADVSKLFAVIRRRVTNTISDGVSLARIITYMMPVKEYEQVKSSLKDKSTHTLSLPHIILSYSSKGQYKKQKEEQDRSLSSSKSFRATQHSVKKNLKERAQLGEIKTIKPRIVLDEYEESNHILERESDAVIPRDKKQIKNYQSNYCPNDANRTDEILSLLSSLIDQPTVEMSDPLSEDQSFLQEVLFRNGRQPSYVLYTAQSLADLERFCTNTSMPTKFRSVLAVDTTYNVSNYYVTQTTYRNLSLLHRNTQKHPWFPGPVFAHRHQEKDDFSYFWQAVKRGKLSLEDLAIIGTDECDELYNGILQESNGNTGHFLGKEHMIKTIQRKLNQPFQSQLQVPL